MRVLYSVLNRFVPVEDLSPYDVADRLTMGGLEVESVERLSDALKECVVAVITDVAQHPESKKLKVLRVSTGREELQVVCGAPNVSKGLKVALALPGAELPNGFLVETAQIRGVKSEGMLLSEIELDLVEETWGILELPEEAPPGDELAKWVYMDDCVLEVSPTPNRGDCFGVLGVAREVAALYKRRLTLPPVELKEGTEPVEEKISVEIEDERLCPRYTARYIEGVKVDESPLWLKVAVKAFGMRPISNVVDVTNYILMEVGHPLHAFDYTRLKGQRIVVRRAREGEYIVTLDGEYRELDTETLVIADANRPVALAGIMGGANSEVTSSTDQVLLESAYFDPISIRRASKRLGLSTEASKRFERGTDIEGLVYASNRACQLILEVAGGRLAKGMLDIYPRPFESPRITVSLEGINGLLGTQVPETEVVSILEGLGFGVEKENGTLTVSVPPHRVLDVAREVDVVEEVARIWGYDRVPSLMPSQRIPHYQVESEYGFSFRIKGLLASCGLCESINYSFISPDSLKKLRLQQEDRRANPVPLLNPLSEEMSVMRTTLLPGLLESASRNHRVRNFDLALFEVGRVFFQGDPPEERLSLGFVMTGRTKGHWSSKPRYYDFFDAKGVLELLAERLGVDFRFLPSKQPFLHPGQSADLLLGDRLLGYVGVLHPDAVEAFELKPPVIVAELDLEELKGRTRVIGYKHISRFPGTTRDLSFVIDQRVPFEEVLEVVLEDRPAELAHVELIDVYRGPGIEEGKVSMTLSFLFVSHERTLSDEEVDEVFWGIAERLKERLGVKLRGEKT